MHIPNKCRQGAEYEQVIKVDEEIRRTDRKNDGTDVVVLDKLSGVFVPFKLRSMIVDVAHLSIVFKKGKGNSLDIAPLTILHSGALQPRKWQLIGTGCSNAAQASGCP